MLYIIIKYETYYDFVIIILCNMQFYFLIPEDEEYYEQGEGW